MQGHAVVADAVRSFFKIFFKQGEVEFFFHIRHDVLLDTILKNMNSIHTL